MRIVPFRWFAWISAVASAAAGVPQQIAEPSQDRWMYPANGSPGTRAQASSFSALPDADGLDDRWGFFLFAFDTGSKIPAGLPPETYRIRSVKVTATIGQDGFFDYDPTYDEWRTYGTPTVPAAVADADTGRPVELHGAGFRNGFTAATFTETSLYGGDGTPGTRNAYPLGFDEGGTARDVSNHVTDQFESNPWAVGTTDLGPGDPVPEDSVFTFDVDPAQPGVAAYLGEGLSAGRIWFSLDSLHPAIQQGGEFAAWYTKDDAFHQLFGGIAPALEIEVDFQIPLSISRDGNSVVLSWQEYAGLTFQLQASGTMAPGSWVTIHSHAATADGPGGHSETISTGPRFYRLGVLPTPP